MRRALALLFALVFALVLAIPVLAAPPVHESGTFDFDNPSDDLSALCLPDINVPPKHGHIAYALATENAVRLQPSSLRLLKLRPATATLS